MAHRIGSIEPPNTLSGVIFQIHILCAFRSAAKEAFRRD
jgi:hypothetical protein